MNYKLHPIAMRVDATGIQQELASLAHDFPGDTAKLRAKALARLKALKEAAHADARALLERTGDGRACAAALSAFQDEIVRLIHDFSATHLYRAQNPSAAERMALIATGGYGRGLLAPSSDVDLLFLLPYKQTAWGESMVESILYFLWDLGYKVGHATRTVDQTIKAAKADMTIRTALLDARPVHGEASLFGDLRSHFERDVMKGTQREFIAAKLQERAERLKRAGMSRYRVEPNVKDGKGGLRDLNMLHWFAAYLNPDGRAIPERNVFTAAEYAAYRRCEDFLWTVRCHLHFLAGTPEERLSFDMQPEMAQRLKYKNRGGMLAVERFMKHYFLIAKEVGDLTRIVCSSLELRQLKTVPSLSDLAGVLPWSAQAKIAGVTDFRVDTGRLNAKSADVFEKDPVNLIRLFVEARRNNLLLHPEAIRLVRGSLKLVNDRLRADREANRLFLGLLTSRDAPDTSLRAMNEAGVLGRFIPDFGRIVSLAQFNMYHHYTVDEHLIRAVGILSEIEKGALGDELPLSTGIIADIQNRNALYVALLVHDAAKGRAEDHSVLGASIARSLALRFGLPPEEAETAAWLVEHHLVMSQFAQSRDIGDPKTVRDFADIVQSPERLKLLLLLTVADIRAVGPGIWTGWKGQLLRSLYYDTEPLLGGRPKRPRQVRIVEAETGLREALAHWPEPEIARFVARHTPEYLLRTDTSRQAAHAESMRRLENGNLRLAFDLKSDAFRSLTELTLVTPDRPGLLMVLAGACAAAGANIVSAQISTTTDGLALDTLALQRALPDDDEELERGEKIARVISECLDGKRAVENLQAPRPRSASRLQAFHVHPDVILDNTASNEHTVVEVHARDRPGLLFDLTRGLSDLGLDIASAHIATFGEKAVDVFYVTDGAKRKLAGDEVKANVRRHLCAAADAA